MNMEAAVTGLLCARLGLAPELFGPGAVQRAVKNALEKAGDGTRAVRVARLLRGEGKEWESVIDEIVVRETWFFRDREPFRFLASYVAEEWLPAHRTGCFRVLCIPCGSGEEPLSIAIALLECGLEKERIRIDAADVSDRALELAERKIYRKNSFREKLSGSEEQRFLHCPEGRRVNEEISALMSYEKANLLDLSGFRQREPYDAVFCRNALIYFEEAARCKVVKDLCNLLPEGSLLFTGHTELVLFLDAGFSAIKHSLSFACRKKIPLKKRIAAKLPAAKKDSRSESAHAAELLRRNAAAALSIREAGQLADRGELESAAAVCRRILDAGSQDPDVYSLLGMISASGGKMEGAEDLFLKALFLDPYHYQSLVHMSLLCERRGDMDSSRLYRARAERIVLHQAHSPEKRISDP
jgi:chemotaxis protein methyltransferase WspC